MGKARMGTLAREAANRALGVPALPPAEPPQKQQPYEPPAVISEEVFETLAIACSKAGGTPIWDPQGTTRS